MRARRGLVLILLLLWCVAAPLTVWGQGNTMGTISGKVVDPEGLPIPGVTITVESANLQGTRTSTTSANGDFVLPLLPAGEYMLTFELQGFSVVKQTQRVTPGDTAVIPAIKLSMATLSETVNVVGKVENFAQTATSATSLTSDLVQKLPTSRNLTETVLLAPGVNSTGPSGNVTISGALSYEGLYLVNGVVVNENLRGQPLGLFVEDAIQETTTTTGSVSAEYGRFAGGVVNTITKSGGNTFSGSFRDNLANDNWREVTPFGEPKTNKTVPTYTYTFGGPILKDKLWFFHAGRYTKTATSMLLNYSALPLDQTTKEYRFEETLRYSLTPNHNFRATVFNLATQAHNYRFGGMDLRQVYDRRLPQSMQSFNYNAILSNRFFFEVQYSKRYLAWQQDGARFTDRIQGTQLSDRSKTSYWSPTFCGVCTNEERNNQDVLAKGSYFLSTSKTGSHNFVFGADVFKDYRFSNNHQSGSDFIVATPRSIQVGSDFYPVLTADGQTLITYRPILVPTKGTNIWTYSGFFNDAWRFNNNFSFNLGLRWDRNKSIDSSGAQVATDSTFSPRLSATWDPRGDGKTTVFASYARYVAAMANSIADAGSAGGQPALFQWVYRGPTVNTDGPNLLPDAALPILFAWWDAQGGANNPNLNSVTIPGLSTKIGEGLKAQYMTEYMAGMSHNFGRVLVRVDGSYRPASNFYGNFTNLQVGQVTNPTTGAKADLTLVQNTESVWRRYWGINSQVSWRARQNLTMGANWTISRNRGNVEGENSGSGPIRTGADQYMEYKDPAWNYPVGDLSSDQRHRARVFLNYDKKLGSFGSLGIGLLEMINSGSPYGASGSIDMRKFVSNPGYATAQGGSTVAYYFTARDAYRLPWNYRTDVSVNYSYKVGGRYEMFWQGQVLNLLNAQRLASLGSINTTVMTADVPGSIKGLQAFNAFTTDPVQGTNWVLDPGTTNKDGHGNPVPFGEALAYAGYQVPLTFRMSFGFRF